MSSLLSEAIMAFNKSIDFSGKLPPGFAVMNPFRDNPETMKVMEAFYRKYYADNRPRKFIIGINPSRHGAGVTGVPFTDTKRLEEVCGIRMKSARTHEVSSVFVYDLIEQYGGPERFYADCYINSGFPLAIVRNTTSGKQVNANYYDDPELFQSVREFMKDCLKRQVAFGLRTDEAVVMGKKNAQFIRKLNDELQLFGKLTVVEHPRYIQQYKSREKEVYLDRYLRAIHDG